MGGGVLGVSVELVRADLRHDRTHALLAMLAVLMAVTPLLLCYGLKEGSIAAYQKKYLDYPGAREIVMRGHGAFDDNWFRRLRARRDVGFVVPAPFAASSAIVAVDPSGEQQVVADVIPSADGDPLLATLPGPRGLEAVVLTQSVAEQLRAAPGRRIVLRVSRVIGGQNEVARIPVLVRAVLPAAQLSDDRLLVSSALMSAIETYRAGRQAPELHASNGAAEGPIYPPYPRARIYARTLADVVGLERYLNGIGTPVFANDETVVRLLALSAGLERLFGLLLSIAIFGLGTILAAIFWSMVERRRYEIATMRLFGWSARSLALQQVAKSVVLAGCGSALATLIYFGFAVWVNGGLASLTPAPLDLRSAIPLPVLALFQIGTLVVAALAAAGAAFTASRIEPALALRER